MQQLVSSSFRLGIIAGGQLGKMLAQAATNWDVTTWVMDTDANGPAAPVAAKFVSGDYADYDAVYNFGKEVDMLTFEIEHVNVEALRRLKAEGKTVHPDPEALAIIQDKGLQKQFYAQHNLPTSDFKLYDSMSSLVAAIESGERSLPFVQKSRKAGYDGRGVAVIKNAQDAEHLLDGPGVAEDMVEIQKELAVVVGRNTKGEIKCFPAVEMDFNPKANLVERLICPANISPELEARAQALAERVIQAYDIAGVLAVELFLDKQGKLWVNEVAPRPHNSGHHSIESLITSQYEQHLRAIFGWPLGSTYSKLPAVMINLLGAPEQNGPVRYDGLEEAMAIEGVKVHIYGKKQTRPFRKMGHVTVLAPTIEEAIEKADRVKELLTVNAWTTHASV